MPTIQNYTIKSPLPTTVNAYDESRPLECTKQHPFHHLPQEEPITYDYTLGTVKLIRVCNEKDLGVITSYELSWDLHINSIISKANKMLGVLKRTSTLLTNIKTRPTLYLSLVKSQLCYASEVWSPVNNIQLSKRVESVQRRATRWILMSRGELSYKERLLALNLLPLINI